MQIFYGNKIYFQNSFTFVGKRKTLKISSPLEWFLMEVHGSPFSPGTPGLSHPVRKHIRCVKKQAYKGNTHPHTYKDSWRSSFQLKAQSRSLWKKPWIIDWLTGEKVISPYMVRERCHRRHCRMTLPQVRSGDSGRRTRWLQPLLWNPPLTLKAPGGSSAHTPRETKLHFLNVFLYFSSHVNTSLTFSFRTETQVFILWAKLSSFEKGKPKMYKLLDDG